MGSKAIYHFSGKSDHKEEKSVGSFTHEQIIICCQTQLDNIAHEETIIILYPVIRKSLGGLSANEKEVQFALNDNDI